jgi:hypothetical protein
VYDKEGCSHTLRYEETINWREELGDRRLTSNKPEIGETKERRQIEIMTNRRKLGYI